MYICGVELRNYGNKGNLYLSNLVIPKGLTVINDDTYNTIEIISSTEDCEAVGRRLIFISENSFKLTERKECITSDEHRSLIDIKEYNSEIISVDAVASVMNGVLPVDCVSNYNKKLIFTRDKNIEYVITAVLGSYTLLNIEVFKKNKDTGSITYKYRIDDVIKIIYSLVIRGYTFRTEVIEGGV